MIEIEIATPADLPTIKRMVQALSTFHGDTAQASLAWLQKVFFDTPELGTAFVARRGGEIVGYAGVIQHPSIHEGRYRFDIQHLYIAEPHRSKGIGRALVHAARDYAAGRGGPSVTIGTDPENAGAQAAYRAMGLEDISGAPRFRLTVKSS